MFRLIFQWVTVLRRALFLAFGLGTLLASTAFAAGPDSLVVPVQAAYPAQRLPLATKASELLGSMVYDASGNHLGKIQDFLIDPSSWRILCALVTPAHLYGAQDYFVVIPAASFRTATVGSAGVNITNTNFIASPRLFLTPRSDAASVSQYLTHVFTNFDQQTFWDTNHPLTAIVRASLWLGMDVQDKSGANLGNLQDFILNLPAQRVLFASISFYGWDSNLHLAPPAVLSPTTDGAALSLDVRPDQVWALVHNDQFLSTDIIDPAFAANVYRFFGSELDLDSAPNIVLDPTRLKDRFSPLSTDNTLNDTQLAQAVAKAIFRSPATGPSTQAINVRPENGRIVLAGQVASEQQRDTFLRTAESVAGPGKIANQLEIKP